jgi:hypothetical protein
MTNDTENQRQEPEAAFKLCMQCQTFKPLTEFASRSGRAAGRRRRRGTCRTCRLQERKPELAERLEKAGEEPAERTEQASKPKRRRRKRSKGKKPAAPLIVVPAPQKTGKKPVANSQDASALRPTRQGFIRMRGKTDSGRTYYQEIDPEFAKILVRENAAFVLNRHTIRRIYSNKEFRRLILTRDRYTCHFCGHYGDTIDHLLPRAKGGHTTPVNCVCACNECNQSKADRDLDEFTQSLLNAPRINPDLEP